MWSKRNAEVFLPRQKDALVLDQSSVVLDLGANVGDISSLFARTGATVYAFEPDPNAFAALSRRFRFCKRVHCINKGVMDQVSTFRLYFCNPKSKDRIQASVGSSFHQSKNEMGDAMASVEVECVNINDFIFGLNTRVSLLKMDIEGVEAKVINSMIDTGSIQLVDKMLVETHERQIPEIRQDIEALRERIQAEGLSEVIDLSWM